MGGTIALAFAPAGAGACVTETDVDGLAGAVISTSASLSGGAAKAAAGTRTLYAASRPLESAMYEIVLGLATGMFHKWSGHARAPPRKTARAI